MCGCVVCYCTKQIQLVQHWPTLIEQLRRHWYRDEGHVQTEGQVQAQRHRHRQAPGTGIGKGAQAAAGSRHNCIQLQQSLTSRRSAQLLIRELGDGCADSCGRGGQTRCRRGGRNNGGGRGSVHLGRACELSCGQMRAWCYKGAKDNKGARGTSHLVEPAQQQGESNAKDPSCFQIIARRNCCPTVRNPSSIHVGYWRNPNEPPPR